MEAEIVKSPDEGNFLANLLLFGRLLRAIGLDINPGRMIDLVTSLEWIEIGRKSDFYFATRSLLIHRREDLPVFERAFAAFWRKPADWQVSLDALGYPSLPPREELIIRPPPLVDQDSGEQGLPGEESDRDDLQLVLETTLTYSDREYLRRKDFGELTVDEIDAIRRMMAGLIWQLGTRRTRRRRPGSGPSIDMRRTLRRNLRYGGDVLHWARREPKFKPRPLVVIADISGSMERYTRLLLHFIFSLVSGLNQRVEAFVFSTQLTRISRQIRRRHVDKALQEVARSVPDWSGGTRIGAALKQFNFDWGRRVLSQGAVVLLISDGWDRGDAQLLKQEIARLQRSCYRLIWLNPLLGSPDYEPLTRGMRTALPYIDDFLPVHNLASLEDLAKHLIRLEDRRPARGRLGSGEPILKR